MTLLVAAVLLPLAACSVKEDRSVCPSVLTVRLEDDEAARLFDSLYVYVLGRDGRIASFLASVQDLVDGLVEVEVPRMQPIRVVVASDTGDMTVGYDAVACPPGSESGALIDGMDEVFAQVYDERCEAVVSLRKDYMNLTVLIQDLSDCILTVSADFSSLSVPEGTPAGPEFRAECREVSAGTYAVRIPRQTEGSNIVLSVDMVMPDGRRVRSGYFLVGQILSENGYDWSETFLRDAVISLDGDLILMGVRVLDWDPQDLDTVLR